MVKVTYCIKIASTHQSRWNITLPSNMDKINVKVCDHISLKLHSYNY